MKKKVVVMMLMAAMCLGTACGQSSQPAAPAAQEETTEAPAEETAEAAPAEETAAETPAAEAPAAEPAAEAPAEEVEAPVSSKEAGEGVAIVTAKSEAVVPEETTAKELPASLNQFKTAPTEAEAAANNKEAGGEATVDEAVEGAEAATGEAPAEETASAEGKVPEEGTEVLANQTIDVIASSQYNDYNVSNLFDGLAVTAWAESVAGNGIGEYIEFLAPAGMYMDHIYIITGDQKSEETYWQNGSPTEICIVSGNQRQYLSLYDEFGIYQSADFEPVVSNGSIRIYITGVRPGSVYQDTCISEIWF